MATRKKSTPAKRKTRQPRVTRKAIFEAIRQTFLSGGDWLPMGSNAAGVDVTAETALTLPHYLACLRVLSQTPCLLPFEMRRSLGERGSERVRDHRIEWFMNNPHPWMTKFSFWQLLVQWAAGWGLGLARIIRDNRGDPARMDPMHPNSVRPFEDGGELWWEWHVRDSKGIRTEYVPDVECFRIHGMGGDGITGYSCIQYAAGVIGQGLAHQDYGSSFFANGVWGSGVLEHPQALKPEAQKLLQDSINEKWAGPKKSFRPLLLQGGMKWNTLTIPNADAQLIEFGSFNAYQVCRVIGVQPHKIGLLEGAKYKNIEEENIAWVQDGVMPWTQRIEEEAQKKLLFRPGTLYFHINIKGLLRADFATRMEGYQKRVNTGTMSPNDVRRLEDEPLISGPEGDAYYMQGANMTLEDIFDPPEPPAPAPAPDMAPARPEDDPASVIRGIASGVVAVAESRRMAETQRPAFVAAVRHCLRRESNALSRVREKHRGAALAKWAEDWQRKERQNIEAAFSAPLACLGALTGSTATITVFLDNWAPRAVERAVNGGVDEETLVPALSAEAFEEATR